MDHHYEFLYNTPLFDDLHNFCPDIIYNPGRFTDVQSLVQYISNCARMRGNRFTSAQEHYLNRMPTLVEERQPQQPPQPQQPQQPQQQPPQTVEQTYNSLLSNLYSLPNNRNTGIGLINRFPRTIRPTQEHYHNGLNIRNDSYIPLMSFSNSNIFDSLLDVFTNTGTGLRAANPLTTALLTPVVVRPTPEQITSATELLVAGEEDRFDNCSICVESINPNTEVRRINHCRHTFHRTCIDTWFDRNVRCPNCRHDIRDNPVTTATATATATAIPSTIGAVDQSRPVLGIYYEISEVNEDMDNDEYDEEDY